MPTPTKTGARKRFPTIGCCGIDCCLCPRFHAAGDSRCPGCGGDGFERKHPACSCKSCCADRHGLEVCSLCAKYPCPKFQDREKVQRDSFVTHQRIFPNHERIREHGFDAFVADQRRRESILRKMLDRFDDGRSKGFYCLAAALLPIGRLEAALNDAAPGDAAQSDAKRNARALRAALKSHADAEGVSLSLGKPSRK